MIRAILNFFCGDPNKEQADPVQTTEQEHVEETTEQNPVDVVAPAGAALAQDPVEEEFVVVDANDAEGTTPESCIVSRVVRPLLYTAKYGAQVLYLTASGIGNISIVVSYGLSGVACIPHGMSKALEEREEQNKETAGYLHTTEHKVIACVKNVLSGTADVLHGGAHILKGAGQAVVYFGDVAYCVN